MAIIKDSLGNTFTVPDAAAPSYLDAGLVYAAPEPPAVPAKSKRPRRTRKPSTDKEAPIGVPIRTDSAPGPAQADPGPVQPQ